MGTKILQAALALHEKVASTFRKTAVNFHYEFTVRHLANVFQGLLMSTPEQFNNVTKLSRLWLHESERVYADRLVSAAVSFSCKFTLAALHVELPFRLLNCCSCNLPLKPVSIWRLLVLPKHETTRTHA